MFIKGKLHVSIKDIKALLKEFEIPPPTAAGKVSLEEINGEQFLVMDVEETIDLE